MAHTFTSIHLHIIFSTKDRMPLITPQIKPRLLPYLGGALTSLGSTPVLINAIEDHIHLLTSLPPALALSNLVRDLKSNSSKWANETFAANFGWQIGYAAFSVSQSAQDAVRQYIETQETHHRTISFHDEYLAFLHRHNLPYDPRFVFDGEFTA